MTEVPRRVSEAVSRSRMWSPTESVDGSLEQSMRSKLRLQTVQPAQKLLVRLLGSVEVLQSMNDRLVYEYERHESPPCLIQSYVLLHLRVLQSWPLQSGWWDSHHGLVRHDLIVLRETVLP